METRKVLQGQILQAVGERVGSLGFRPSLSRQEFSRKTPSGKEAFHIGFVPHKNGIDVTADVAIRFDRLEELVHRLTDVTFLSDVEKKNTYSVGSELGRLVGEGQLRWTVVSPIDVEPVARAIATSFKQIGLPYFERYEDMCAVAQALRKLNRESELLNSIPEKLARNAVALAHLCGGETEELLSGIRSYLRAIPGSDIEAFEDFVVKAKEINV